MNTDQKKRELVILLFLIRVHPCLSMASLYRVHLRHSSASLKPDRPKNQIPYLIHWYHIPRISPVTDQYWSIQRINRGQAVAPSNNGGIEWNHIHCHPETKFFLNEPSGGME